MREAQRIADAIATLKRALARAGIDAPFAIEFDESAAGSRLAAIITRDLPIEVIISRQTGLAPELSGRREQAEINGVKVRWPGRPAQPRPALAGE
ncbi:hypothetical protein M6G65_07860 [Methylobacterium tardum]|uniref:hypothetical protein n=1 Tax=Methylobacterium tardum TaxID=374432 RepID=UPI00202291A5|nr:hypothetical protein [Methylobacterium tardum]URD38348.1 hypothetical protein M6G65_07860 [Methylobacterium tardum]